jgi:hypothetical protein
MKAKLLSVVGDPMTVLYVVMVDILYIRNRIKAPGDKQLGQILP